MFQGKKTAYVQGRKGPTAQTTIYHYDIRGHIIAESGATGTILLEYAYLDGQPLAQIKGSTVYYYHNDHLGTPLLMTDSRKGIVWQGEFKPFGEAYSITGKIANNLRFPGQYYDSETGLNYNYYRDYNPVIGRYVEADLIGLKGGLNLYSYASNNSIRNFDPFGLKDINGMKCREIDRQIYPGYSSGTPYKTYNAGYVWICTDIVIESTIDCICIYEKNERIAELYKRFISFEVTYKCRIKDACDDKYKIVKKFETERVNDDLKYRYKPTGYAKNILGTTTDAFGGCSCALEGVGAMRSMHSLL